ncbi:hypothetical protein LUZ61_015877 [Rhynchospora tenuis]|uniref:F-box domain-containing protein n=1 Tax=Rhynchospora tenuis TaxID=198213 RepID=A0AAD5Z4G6_9POAL|nr:hypothetical protein LUZ61_015877 [Rhynchospora tenuis]
MRQKTEHVDRLSKLPDSILTHILSFLPTRKAIQTSLLAKRYRNLWASVPVLDFHFHDSHPLDEYAEKRSCECEEKFVKFVDGVFEHREPLTLDALKLVLIDDNSDFAPATTWLDSAAMLKPKFLSAKILTEACTCCFEIPESVFTSESLQKLVLKLSFDSISPRYVNLPNLKMLSLSTVSIEDGAMEKLSSGLPLLEEMVLCNCILNSCSIYSSTMKRLVLDNCHSDITSPPDILISIPSLAFLKIHNCTVRKLKFKKLESLVKAQIHCTEFSNEEPLFLTGLLNVTSLKLVIPMV